MKLAEKGKIEEEIKKRLKMLNTSLVAKFQNELTPDLLKTKQSSNEIRLAVENQLDDIFSVYDIYTIKEKKIKKQVFCQNIENILDLLINKKICCSIDFNGHYIFKFFKALSAILDEVEFQIRENLIYILTMDPLRIAIIEIVLSNDSMVFYQNGKISFNLTELQKALKCKSSDESKTALMFGKEKFFIAINSNKFKSQIKRELNAIDFHQSGNIDINKLIEFRYPCKFSLSKEKLEYLIENFGLYSEILEIYCFKDKISFLESGESGKNEITWGRNHIPYISFNLNKNKEENDENQVFVKEMFSFDFFKMIYKMASILNKNDVISFSIREDYPLKAVINYPKLEKTKVNFYISPRK